MKRFFGIFLSLLLVAGLCSCSEQTHTQEVSINGQYFQIDSETSTIFDGTHTYSYAYSGTSEKYRITITYPNGATYWYSQANQFGQGGWSEDYDENTYVSGDTLCAVVEAHKPKIGNPGKVFGAFFLLLLGALNVAFPGVFWYLGYGWRYRDAEPSDAALTFGRIGGIAMIVIGLAMLVLR